MESQELVSQDEPTQLAEHRQTAPVAVDTGISPLVAMLASGELKAEHVEQAMQLQQQHEAYEAKKAFSAALANFRKIAPTLRKNKTVDFPSKGGRTTYSHTTLGYALTEVNPLLGECDLNLSWHPKQDGGVVYVVTRLTHTQGHSEEVQLQAAPDTSGSKNAIQAVSSTITYLKREGAMSILGLASEQDDDGRASGPIENVAEVKIISDEQAGRIEDLLIKLEDHNAGFRDRWENHYSTSWGVSDTPPGLAIPTSEYGPALAELTNKLKKYDDAAAGASA